MRKPKIYTEADALEAIRSALDEADIDDLAQILSQIVQTDGPVVVVHDGNEDLTPEMLGADQTIPVSSAYEDGEAIGDILEDGTIDESEEDED